MTVEKRKKLGHGFGFNNLTEQKRKRDTEPNGKILERHVRRGTVTDNCRNGGPR